MTGPAAREPGTPLRFRSRDQRVLGARARWQEDVDSYTVRVAEILTAAQAGPPLAAVFGGSGEFTGLAVPASGALPPGWQAEAGLALPDPARAAGRWVAAAVATARHPGELRRSLPGLPPAVTEPEDLPGWRAELLERGTALYVGWPAGPPGGGCYGWPDPRLWQPAAGNPEARTGAQVTGARASAAAGEST